MKPALSIFLALLSPLAAFSPELSIVNPRGGQRCGKQRGSQRMG
ncbi:MAG: hypothetical protein ACRDBP_10545 [Luteolibacter sp.]